MLYSKPRLTLTDISNVFIICSIFNVFLCGFSGMQWRKRRSPMFWRSSAGCLKTCRTEEVRTCRLFPCSSRWLLSASDPRETRVCRVHATKGCSGTSTTILQIKFRINPLFKKISANLPPFLLSRQLGFVDVSLKLLSYLQTMNLGSEDVIYERKLESKPLIKRNIFTRLL